MKIKILLYEDNDSLRQSLTALLQWQSDAELMAAMPNAGSVLADIQQFTPDVVLMDIDMPRVNGIQALQQIRVKYPELPVIMLTVFEDNENIFNSICAGASGYLLKKNFDQILPAIKDVLTGGAPMTGVIAKKVLSLFPRPVKASIDEESGLSQREQELLQYLMKGYSYKMIADEMQIALETVRSHIKKIYRKLQVNSATEAIYKVSRGKSA